MPASQKQLALQADGHMMSASRRLMGFHLPSSQRQMKKIRAVLCDL
jgi:hypothetical protein